MQVPTPDNTAAIITAIGQLLIPLATAIGIVITAILVRSSKKTNEATLAETKEIKHHVNSAATAAQNKIDALQEKVEALTREMAKDDTRAKLLAQSAAVITAQLPEPKAIPVVVVNDPLRVVPTDGTT